MNAGGFGKRVLELSRLGGLIATVLVGRVIKTILVVPVIAPVLVGRRIETVLVG